MAGHEIVEQVSLQYLPTELVEEVVASPVLSIRDVCSLCRVNWRLYHIVWRIWGRIANARWRYWGECVAKTPSEWYQLCRQRHLCEVNARRLLDQLTARCIPLFLIDEDDLECVSEWLAGSSCSGTVLKCVFKDILEKPISDADLTHQFYGLYVMEHLLRRTEFSQQWKHLLSLPRDQQLLEKGAILLSQWMNPLHKVQEENILTQLDSIAEEVARVLLRRQGGGERGGKGEESKCVKTDGAGTCSGGSDVLSRARQLILPERAVTDAINAVLYGHLGFRGAPEGRYYDVENSYIDKVLERKIGIPISLCTVYQSVASRLGVTLLPVNFPSHFLLRFRHGTAQHGVLTQDDPIFIDAYCRGRYRTGQECLSMVPYLPSIFTPEEFAAAQPIEVFVRMLQNIYGKTEVYVGRDIGRMYDEERKQWSCVPLTSALSLQLTFCSLTPEHEAPLVRLATLNSILMCTELLYCPEKSDVVRLEMIRKLFANQITSTELMSLALDTRAALERKRDILRTPVQAKERKEGVAHHIGMIMKHKRYFYRCVIYGWDPTCKMSEAWILQMGVDFLPRGRHQPFYNVLADDGSSRYASQENLAICPPEEMGPIPHWEVGKYFCRFTGDKYIPNCALRERYPQDNCV